MNRVFHFVILGILLCFSLLLQAQTKPKAKSKPKPKPKVNSVKKVAPPVKTNTTSALTANPTTASRPLNILDSILRKNQSAFGDILKDPKKHHVQIIYTQITRDKLNKATFTNTTFRLNKEEFFYPASMVKLPSCALALEKAEELAKSGITVNARMLTDKANDCQDLTHADASAENGYPSIANYIKRMLLVSDNIAYSRIYEFLTPEYIYKKMTSKGYPTARIRIRFDPDCLGKPNNYTNPIRFLDSTGRLLYLQPAKYFPADQLAMPIKNAVRKIDFRDPNVSLLKDFTHSNFFSLQDMHEVLKSIMFPRETPSNKAFKINANNRKLLWKYLQMMPYESDFPSYPNREQYFDSYKKYLFYGRDSSIIANKNIRIFNVVGVSYGYTTDCAYIVDFEHNIEFMLTATYFIEEGNGVIDGTDETYDREVLPFFRNLGQSVYKYELTKKRNLLPNLLEFKF